LEGEFISSDDLSQALERQKHCNELLGEILVRMSVLDPMDLDAVLSTQDDLSDPGKTVRMAAGVRQIFGNLLLQAKRITPEHLDFALREQERTAEMIGSTMVRIGMISASELDSLLAFQRYQCNNELRGGRLRLGELLVATGQISRNQLDGVLKKQSASNKKIGEMLVESGYATPQQVSHWLSLQKKLVTAALVALLSFVSVAHDNDACAASQDTIRARSQITVSAVVSARSSMKIIEQVTFLVITADDIRRGYVEVAAASRIEVKNNSLKGYLLSFESLMTVPFKEVQIQGLGNEIQINSGGGWIPRPYSRTPVTMELGYRFILSENAEPGTYSWPLALSTHPL
jgi:hypothetical protein